MHSAQLWIPFDESKAFNLIKDLNDSFYEVKVNYSIIEDDKGLVKDFL